MSDLDNLLILDASSGRTLLRIKTGDLGEDDPAEPVSFGPRDQVFTAQSVLRHSFFTRRKVKVWNATTGRLGREFGYPGWNVSRLLALSRDGTVLVGCTCQRRIDWRGDTLDDERIPMWDAATGKVIAASSDLNRQGPPKWSFIVGLGLSADGMRALAYGVSELEVFDLPEVPRHAVGGR